MCFVPCSPEDLCLTFSYEVGCAHSVVDLVPDGRNVEVRDLLNMSAQGMRLPTGCTGSGCTAWSGLSASGCPAALLTLTNCKAALCELLTHCQRGSSASKAPLIHPRHFWSAKH